MHACFEIDWFFSVNVVNFHSLLKGEAEWANDVLCDKIKILYGYFSKANKSGMFWKGMPTLSKSNKYEPILKPMPAFYSQLPVVVLGSLYLD